MLKYLGFALVFIACLYLQSCGTDEDNSEDVKTDDSSFGLKDLSWLEGSWIDKGTLGFQVPPTYFMETWKVYEDSLSGKGFSITETDTTLKELVGFKVASDKVTFVATPAGEALVGFGLIDHNETSFTFENKANNFPQQVTYEKVGTDSLHITFSGVSNGIQRDITFKYSKVH